MDGYNQGEVHHNWIIVHRSPLLLISASSSPLQYLVSVSARGACPCPLTLRNQGGESTSDVLRKEARGDKSRRARGPF